MEAKAIKSKKRLQSGSPIDSEQTRRPIKQLTRKMTQANPLQKYGFSKAKNPSKTTATNNIFSMSQPRPSLDIPITCQKDMTEFCIAAMEDPRVKTLVKVMKKELFEEEMEQVAENTSRIAVLESTVDRQEIEINAMKQESKRKSLRIFNPEWNDDKADTTDLIVQFIKDELHCTDFGAEFIDYTHWAGKRTQGKEGRPILVSFIHTSTRDTVLGHAKSVPEGCSINEDLTPALAYLAYCARSLKRSGDINETWVKHGKIHVKAHENAKSVRILCMQDLIDQVHPPLQTPEFSWKAAISVIPELKPMDYIQLVRSGDYLHIFDDPNVNAHRDTPGVPASAARKNTGVTPSAKRNGPPSFTPTTGAGKLFSGLFSRPMSGIINFSDNTTMSSNAGFIRPPAPGTSAANSPVNIPLPPSPTTSNAQPTSSSAAKTVTTVTTSQSSGASRSEKPPPTGADLSALASPTLNSAQNSSNRLLQVLQSHPPEEKGLLPASLQTADQALSSVIVNCTKALSDISSPTNDD